MTSPNATQVIPSIDGRLATAYNFPTGNSGLFRITFTYSNTISGVSAVNVNTGTLLLTGTIDPDTFTVAPAATLLIEAGSSVVDNITDSGTVSFNSAGALSYAGAISGGGMVKKIGAGTTTLTGVDGVSGGTDIASGELVLGSGGSISGAVTFTGASATLGLATGTNQIGGNIAGAVSGDAIDLGFLTFASGDKAVWQQSGGTGTLTVETSGGSTLATLTLAGPYNTADFAVTHDSQNNVLINLVTALSPVVTTGNPSATFTAAGLPVILDGAIAIADGESTTIAGATVQITGGMYSGDGDVLTTSTAGTAITASYNAGTETLTLSGTDTLTDYQAVLRLVTFSSANLNPTAFGADPTRTVTWIVNDGINSSVGVTTSLNVNALLYVASGDFNHSADADLLLQSTDGTPTIFVLNGGNANVVTGANPGTSWQLLTTGDFNGDGNADLLYQNQNGTPAIWLMNGTTEVNAVALADPGANWQIKATGDFNSDGKSDVLFQNTNGTPAIWFMNGTTVINTVALANPGTSWQMIGSGDFFRTGFSNSILFQNVNGTPAIWKMNGGTIVTASTLPNPTSSFRIIGTGDFAADGHNDSIVFQNNDGQPAIWVMNGFTVVNEVALPNPGSSWVLTGIGNYTGAANGQSDLFFENTSTGQAAVWIMNGTSMASAALVTPQTTFQSYSASQASSSAAATDSSLSSSLTADQRTAVFATNNH